MGTRVSKLGGPISLGIWDGGPHFTRDMGTGVPKLGGPHFTRTPDAYQASGEIYLPYGRIAEPFTAYVDMTSGQSRLDTYGGEIY